ADHVHFRYVTLVANLNGGCKRHIHLLHPVGIASALEIGLCQQAYCTREINASAEPIPDTEPFLKVTYTLCDIAAVRECPSEEHQGGRPWLRQAVLVAHRCPQPRHGAPPEPRQQTKGRAPTMVDVAVAAPVSGHRALNACRALAARAPSVPSRQLTE